MARSVRFSFLRGGGSSLEVLYGKVSLTPTNLHTLSSTAVLPAPTTFDLVNGTALATNVAPTPAPVGGSIAWAYKVKITDNFGKSWEYLVGVPDGTTEINFNVLPRYSETRPPAFGVGPAGPAGQSATIAIGTTTSGATPAVTNTGTSTEAVLNFTLAKGDKGDTGAGVPAGGTALQVVRKNSANTTTEWATLDKALVGLSNVTNTSDINKPVSTAQKAYIDGYGQLPYRSRLPSASPDDFPDGTSMFVGVKGDGWPFLGQIVTTKVSGYLGGTTQWIYPYSGGTETARSRFWDFATSAWTDFEGQITFAALSTINVKDFGAIGDGVADDTQAIQDAIDNGEGRSVFFPDGKFKISPLTIRTSNCTIYGSPGAEIYSESAGNILYIRGSVEPELRLAANLSTGNTLVVTAVPHGLVVGDSVYLKSQRDALSSDAGEEWRLGFATPGSQGCYFAEFHEVSEVTSTTAFRVRQPILFPSYRVDNSEETAEFAREYATVQKVNMVENLTLQDLNITSGGTAIRTQWTRGTTAVNIKFTCLYDVGAFIMWQDSVDCNASRCKALYNTILLPEIDHHRRNSYKTAGSQDCGFTECSSVNGTQPFDFSYFGGGAPSVRPYAIGCQTVASQNNALTSHGGTYAAQIVNNRFLTMKNGPSVRTRNSTISGNIIIGVGYTGTMGIYLYEAWARDCVVSDNVISGFDMGISISDAAGLEESFRYVGASITGNNITKVNTGVIMRRSRVNKFMGVQGILIATNHISLNTSSPTLDAGGVVVGKYCQAVQISNNIIRSTGTANTSNAVYIQPNASHTKIDNNTFIDTYYGINAPNPDDATALDGRIYPAMNAFHGISSTRRYLLGSQINIWDGGFWASNYNVKAPDPGTATGSDALVLNNLITLLRNRGILS